MFDEQEQKLLSLALGRARRDYKKNSNVYAVSAFDERLDAELRKLVLHYSFDFEAIALHLYFKFPQYAFRMKPQAVQYRWYQLTLEGEGERIRQEVHTTGGKERERRQEKAKTETEQEGGMGEEETEPVVLFDLKEKREHYEAALRMAACLDEQEQQGFMVYRPKFIVDSEFKLERQRSEDTMILSALLDNEHAFEFGAFCAPQAAPLNFPMPPLSVEAAPPAIAAEEQQYMDDDWQAYESD